MISTRDLDQLATANGVELAQLIDRATDCVGDLSEAQMLELIKASVRHESWTTARRASVIAAFSESVEAEVKAISDELTESHNRACDASGKKRSASAASHDFDDAVLVDRQVGTEIALKLGISTRAADREIDLALELRRWPTVRQALADGRIDRARAGLICEEVGHLHDPVNQVALLTSILGPDEDFDGDETAVAELEELQDLQDADPWLLAQAGDRALVRELRRPHASLGQIVFGKLRSILRREGAALEPQITQQRAKEASTGRRVWLDPQPDFMANLTIHTTMDAASAAYANLDATARAAKKTGDPRTLDQLKADIGIGWLTEGSFGTLVTRPGPKSETRKTATAPTTTAPTTTTSAGDAGTVQDRTDRTDRTDPADRADPADRGERAGRTVCLPPASAPQIILTVAATTALGLDEEPGILFGPRGPVPVPANIAREIAFDPKVKTWNRLLYDPATGVATDYKSGYRPSPDMNQYVKGRDGHITRMPISCATHLELDHITPYQPPGVPTTRSAPPRPRPRERERPHRGGPVDYRYEPDWQTPTGQTPTGQTTAANLACLGQRDHHLKTDGGLTVPRQGVGRVSGSGNVMVAGSAMP